MAKNSTWCTEDSDSHLNRLSPRSSEDTVDPQVVAVESIQERHIVHNLWENLLQFVRTLGGGRVLERDGASFPLHR